MSRTWRLRVWTRYRCDARRVWSYKTDPEMLAREFRPYLYLTMSSADQDAVRQVLQSESGRASVQARLLPMGLRWPMDVEVITPGLHYRDTSTNALFRHWTHEHQLVVASDGCMYVDEVVFQPALPYCKATALTMERLMTHRHRVAADHLPAEAGGVGVSVLRLDGPPSAG